MFTNLKNSIFNRNRYRSHPEAVIISCFFNPQKSEYRTKAFKTFYNSIKHLNHRIVEVVIGDATPELEENSSISRIYTENLLWHKESTLNYIIKNLPAKYKYVFWVDADVMFTNLDWLVEGVEKLKTYQIIQPFEYCVHLDKDQTAPSFNMRVAKQHPVEAQVRIYKLWRSFAANFTDFPQSNGCSENYDEHGHVGFAWGARRELLNAVPLYDKALIGGADHIIAHAAAGQITHKCIAKSFTEDLEAVQEWMDLFGFHAMQQLSYVPGTLHHIWHGDITKREYLKRIREFTPATKDITEKDPNGLYKTTKQKEAYVRDYFNRREVINQPMNRQHDDGFAQSMMYGYMTDNAMMGTMMGGNPMGAMIGDMMNDGDRGVHTTDHSHPDTRSDGDPTVSIPAVVDDVQRTDTIDINENFS
jgi:hypothetical protein